ncbi:non-canonical poly(A) polymerase TRF5 NDAI_0A06140 [Naumovozyma dairenensis CBS 421]|uniref:polynucleotide adenylyltransferase n=1 Tax=Naumovozyma dairenensis (strain ATCC 10597 / BCRC 20456 / CBS 421 / NBRC 0211 / NRRL Y-12639) TaxID=1071378 RepID=G0W4N1_NAUDC|nr:hypothetical protein NDAI_0A06140 [Naumovozyma dairenensis CBS 421]CCD22769.1 hypothetical protein NDAI_0A06140 [Naumovozyma dairenensis CBS 421]
MVKIASKKGLKSSPKKTNSGNKKFKKMRKSSINKIEKAFKVFNNHPLDQFNHYENLALDVSDHDELAKDGNYNDLIMFEQNEDGNGIHLNGKEIPVIQMDSDTDNGAGTIENNNNFFSKIKGQKKLDLNEDFIGFSDSSEEDADDDEKAGEDTNLKAEQNSEESEGIEAFDEYGHPKKVNLTQNSDYPWILNQDHSKQREIADWLTLEIKDFVSYISPSREEIELRNKTISKLRKAVKELWSDSQLHIFGSYATDLYLPGSDIDCVVNSKMGDKEQRQYLYDLARHLKQKGLTSQVEVIAKARVPIIKFVEKSSQIHIDVSFERTNGVEAAKLIREWLSATPGLRELILIVKQFLSARRLNDVHTGGLGGFTIICLVYSFLSMHPRIKTNDIDPLENLGVLLIEFFELYGKNFAYDLVAISLLDGYPSYIPKSEWRSLLPTRSSFTLAIQDPGDASNNISRSSFNLRDIKKAFAGAFDLLTNKCFELDAATFKDRIGKSILGNVIKYRGKARDFKDERDLIVNRAIVENEKYHKKRSRIVHDDIFLNPSDDDLEDDIKEQEEMYRFEQPEMKKRKKNLKKQDGKKLVENSLQTIENEKKKEKREKKKEKKEKKEKQKLDATKMVDALMGLRDDEDAYDSTLVDSKENTESPLRKATVDSQTRRDYWLSKGQVLAGGTIAQKVKS